MFYRPECKFIRSRVGRGGRKILDRVSTNNDDFTICDSAITPEQQQHQLQLKHQKQLDFGDGVFGDDTHSILVNLDVHSEDFFIDEMIRDENVIEMIRDENEDSFMTIDSIMQRNEKDEPETFNTYSDINDSVVNRIGCSAFSISNIPKDHLFKKEYPPPSLSVTEGAVTNAVTSITSAQPSVLTTAIDPYSQNEKLITPTDATTTRIKIELPDDILEMGQEHHNPVFSSPTNVIKTEVVQTTQMLTNAIQQHSSGRATTTTTTYNGNSK